ncbi:MAG: hypothetical protein IIX16_05320 [Clostridia bacterium]|nr:hypothetical protein [Clostridia bacterium]
MFFYNRVPLGFYTLVVLVLIPIAIYEYNTKTKKKYPNHPVKYIIATASVGGIVSILFRFAQENNLGVVWTKIINISMIVAASLFILSIVFVYYLLIKRNYFTPEALDKLKRTLTPLLAIIVISVVILIILWPYATA